MAKQQQRVMRVEQKTQLAAMQDLESRSDDELETETRFKAAAQTILGTRSAEKYDAAAARAHFQKALAAARPQERLQIRRMANASLALAERRAGDLKVAAEKLGVEAPTNRQLLGLRIIGIVAPPKSAGIVRRILGIVIAIAAIVVILAAGIGLVKAVSLPFGGLSWDLCIFYGIVLVIIVAVGLVLFGRRRRKAAEAKRDAELAARTGK